MAFGDVVQEDASGIGSNQSCTFAGAPTSGNLLVIGGATASPTATVDTAPSGFTQVNEHIATTDGGFITTAWWYKISDGSETTAAIVWSGGTGQGYYIEYEFNTETLGTVQQNEDNSNVSSIVTSQDSGALAPEQPTNLIVVMICATPQSDADDDGAFTNSFTVDRPFTATVLTTVAFASKIDGSGSESTTYSTSDTGTRMWGGIGVFNETAGGGGTTIINTLQRTDAGYGPQSSQDLDGLI